MRRSKAPLPLMELMVMLLIFALAVVACLQTFVKADRLSRSSESRDRAAALCQNAAEAVRASGGEMIAVAASLDILYPYGSTRMPLELCYDGDWNKAEPSGAVYRLRIVPTESGTTGLGKAHISLSESDTETALFELDVAWQKEVPVYG